MEKLVNILRRKRNKAILFADISGSSALYKSHGNEKAKDTVDGLLSLLTNIVIEHKGTLIKTIGDEIMTGFNDCDSALSAAVSMQQTLTGVKDEALALSIGIGFGEVLPDAGDLFGEAVNDAAHLTHIAQGGQILLAQSVFKSLSIESRLMVREFDRIQIKGDKVSSRIYRMYWQEGDSGASETRMMPSELDMTQLGQESLYLKYKGQIFVLNEVNTPFYIGRDSSKCDLMVDGSQVSRAHCHISISRGKFVLTDHSTNGCYVSSEEKPELYLRREAYPLVATTRLSLGISASELEEEVIEMHY